MAKIIDCFLFFNELDLLKIRLNILYDIVDYFIITESNITFSGNKKKYYLYDLLDSKNNLKKFKNKIIYNYIEIPDYFTNPWDRETYQRNSSIESIKKVAVDDDLIITSDLDEIPSDMVLKNYHEWYEPKKLYHFEQKLYMYYLNNLKSNIWYGSRVCSFSYLKDKTINDIRHPGKNPNEFDGLIIKNAGWHFSYLGDENSIIYKIESFSHQEYNTFYIKSNIKNCLEKNVDIFSEDVKYEIVDVDDSYPKYITKNIKKLSKFILNV